MEIRLRENETMSIEVNSRQLFLSCHLGNLRLTQQGDPDDHSVEMGQDLTINRKGKIVIVALSPTSLTLDSTLRRSSKLFEKIDGLFRYGKMPSFRHRQRRSINGQF